MSINALIANPQVAQAKDPLEQYTNFLQARAMQNQLASYQQGLQTTNRLRAAYQNAIGPNGQLDWNKLVSNAASGNVGEAIPGLLKNEADINKTNADVMNTQQDAIGKRLKNSANTLSGIDIANPQNGYKQYLNHVTEDANDPVIAQMNAARGITPQQYVQQEMSEAQQHLTSPQAWGTFIAAQQNGVANAYATHIEKMQNGGYNDLVASPNTNYGAGFSAGVVPGSVQQETLSPNHPRGNVVNVSVDASKHGTDSFMDAAGKGLGEQYVNLANASQSAPQQVATLDRMMDLVKGGALTGMGADQKANTLRLAKLMGINVPNGNVTLAQTQELQKYIAQNLLSGAKTLHDMGISRMTNMDLGVLTKGSVQGNMSASAIMNLLAKQRSDLVNARELYNQRNKVLLNSPSLGPAMKAIVSQQAPAIPDRPFDPIEHLIMHPETAAQYDEYAKTHGLPPSSQVLSQYQ